MIITMQKEDYIDTDDDEPASFDNLGGGFADIAGNIFSHFPRPCPELLLLNRRWRKAAAEHFYPRINITFMNTPERLVCSYQLLGVDKVVKYITRPTTDFHYVISNRTFQTLVNLLPAGYWLTSSLVRALCRYGAWDKIEMLSQRFHVGRHVATYFNKTGPKRPDKPKQLRSPIYSIALDDVHAVAKLRKIRGYCDDNNGVPSDGRIVVIARACGSWRVMYHMLFGGVYSIDEILVTKPSPNFPPRLNKLLKLVDHLAWEVMRNKKLDKYRFPYLKTLGRV